MMRARLHDLPGRTLTAGAQDRPDALSHRFPGLFLRDLQAFFIITALALALFLIMPLTAHATALQDTDDYTVTGDPEDLTVTLTASPTAEKLKAALESDATTIIVPGAINDLTTGVYNGAQNGKTGTTITLSTSNGLFIPMGSSVTLKSLTIQAGGSFSKSTTKLTNDGTLTMENVVITGFGQGIKNQTDRVIVMKKCDICNNTYAGHGAGIYNQGTLILDGCSFSYNETTAANVFYGGGINSSGGTVYANNTVFANNLLKGGGGSAIAYGTIYLSNCTFVNNTSFNRPSGGAIYTEDNWHAVNCVFAHNKHSTPLTDANKAPASGSNNLYTDSMTWSANTDTGTRTTAEAIYGKGTPDVTASSDRPYGYYVPILDNDTTRGGVGTYFRISGSTAVMAYDSGGGITYLAGSTGLDGSTDKVISYMECGGRAADTNGGYIIGASASELGAEGPDPGTPPAVEPESVAIPTAVTGLKWTGHEQTGVAGGTGYTVTNGAATDVGSYTEQCR